LGQILKIFAEKFGGFGKKPYLCGVYFVEPLKYEKQNEEKFCDFGCYDV
jgi:hypothetical protein